LSYDKNPFLITPASNKYMNTSFHKPEAWIEIYPCCQLRASICLKIGMRSTSSPTQTA